MRILNIQGAIPRKILETKKATNRSMRPSFCRLIRSNSMRNVLPEASLWLMPVCLPCPAQWAILSLKPMPLSPLT